MVRLSVGIEDVGDLLADITQALDAAQAVIDGTAAAAAAGGKAPAGAAAGGDAPVVVGVKRPHE